MSDCQCRECQRDSGTGHGSHLTFSGAPVKITGEATFWTAVGENGTRKSRAFCPSCGAPVYLAFPDMPDIFVASAASLDDPARYKPQMVIWTAAGHAWDHLDSALPKFDKMPPAVAGTVAPDEQGIGVFAKNGREVRCRPARSLVEFDGKEA